MLKITFLLTKVTIKYFLKRKDSIYQVNKRVHDWLKIKCIKEKDFYVLYVVVCLHFQDVVWVVQL